MIKMLKYLLFLDTVLGVSIGGLIMLFCFYIITFSFTDKGFVYVMCV